ncbi:MAG: LysM peptidoglycan-binding domain-containing protein [Desulfobacterales bacterium]|nr:LysM peptidoglycan-binding domain-containing protein [Desulfobacterales bacterium]
MNKKPFFFCFITGMFLVLMLSAGKNVSAAGGSLVITVKVEKNQSIRDIAQQYLNDPDLWPDVLRSNGLKSPHEVLPGMTLRIPVGAISKANQKINDSKKLIREATKAGAKIFAPEIIAKAIKLREKALKRRKSGRWSDCASLADSSADEAKKALKISMANQDVAAEAILDNTQGEVQMRKPSDNVWKNVARKDILLEGEKIRTLSQSFADILFRDDSRLHLKENSQALIQKMRANLLDDTEEAKVSLIQGDVFALLAGGKKGKRFNLNIPGVKTKINSDRFWVGRDGKSTRFANYEGEIEVDSGGKKVVLKENQGSIVQHNQKPSAPVDLLPAPDLIGPHDGYERADAGTVRLKWKKVKGAKSYLLEIATDASFLSVILNKTVPGSETIFPGNLGTGLFNWRISAVSSDEMPGRPSKSRSLRIMDDDRPPFLVIQHPKEGAIFAKGTVEVSGNTEEGATLTIQEKPVDISETGEYKFSIELFEGENTITVTAIDRAGLITELKRKVALYPDSEIRLSFDPSLMQIARNHFLVGNQGVALIGTTEPECSVAVTSLSGTFSGTAKADKKGRFQVNVQVKADKEEFTIEITSRTGKTRKEHFIAEIDSTPPVIRFKPELPFTTNQKKIKASGLVEGGTSLELNGNAVPLKAGRFSHEIELNPGMNKLNYTAQDQAGNIAVIKKEILADSDTPELVSHKVSLKKARGGERAKVTVVAKDATGLVKAAPFTVQVGKMSLTGVMKLSGTDGKYVGSFRVPNNVKGTVRLVKVTLSDYLGNRKEYRIK